MRKNKLLAKRRFIPQRKNANRHTPHGARLLEKSLQQDGWLDAQTAAADGEIISGSLRLEIAAEKFADVEPIVVESDGTRPVIVVRTDIPNADDPRAKRLSVAANQIAHTDYNPDGDLLKQWAEEDKDIRAMFADSEWRDIVDEADSGVSADAEPQVDRAAELNEKWQVRTGDLWQIGEHRLLCGDSTKREDVERVMGGEMCQLVVTDPPYGVSYADKNEFLNEYDGGKRNQTPIENDYLSKEQVQEVWRGAFANCYAVMDAGAVIYCFMPQGGDQMMMMMMMSERIEPRHELIWLKNNHVLGRVDYAYKHEPILYAWKEGGHKFYGGFQTSVLECARPQSSDLHPTMKPVELIERLIFNSSVAGEVVFDPFLGSGTTMVAAQNLGRKCRAIEISPAYCAVTLQRMADAFPQLEIQRL